MPSSIAVLTYIRGYLRLVVNLLTTTWVRPAKNTDEGKAVADVMTAPVADPVTLEQMAVNLKRFMLVGH
jgi:hypothetical protein